MNLNIDWMEDATHHILVKAVRRDTHGRADQGVHENPEGQALGRGNNQPPEVVPERQHSAELLANGIDPDYLAYAIIYLLSQEQ